MRNENLLQIRESIIFWGKDNYQDFPWRSTEVAWFGLIAEILLQRTRAKNVIPVFLEFCDRYKKPSDLANASLSEIEDCIFPLGLLWRAPLLQKLGKELTHLNGKIPDDYSSLVKLSGVGDYVASAWLSFHGKYRKVLIDANIVRFYCRITGNKKDGETRRKKWIRDFAEDLTPFSDWRAFNYALLDFSMLVCGNKPNCNICEFRDQYCVFRERQVG